jgi:O-acetyl-ADP-ribose deacetylase (regulator of RNase III)
MKILENLETTGNVRRNLYTGAYGFGPERAARIAVGTVKQVLAEKTTIEQVIFVCFSKSSYNHHQQAVQDIITNKE